MPQLRAQLPFARNFHSLGLRARVVLCQLPLLSCMLVIAAVFALAERAMFANPLFALCLLLHAVLLAACAGVPWERLPERSFQIVPVLDFALIALLLHAVAGRMRGWGCCWSFRSSGSRSASSRAGSWSASRARWPRPWCRC
ncbi:hypothetical protein [Arthrobacter sp. USHLN218]|uniref:hypothetical protein n=1 Tax=Arthrobacter sp. USHLN218 TaxID=3081232 RepID=UPI0030176A9F